MKPYPWAIPSQFSGGYVSFFDVSYSPILTLSLNIKRLFVAMNSSTFFTLMAEYGTGDIPLEKCCEKYFGMSLTKASAHARHQTLPIPAYRGGSQKSMWLISAVDLANHIDKLQVKARLDWQRLNP